MNAMSELLRWRHSVLEIVRLGGPSIVVLMILSVALYAQGFYFLIRLHRLKRFCKDFGKTTVPRAHREQLVAIVVGSNKRHRRTLSALVAAAPLMGLLGTVHGMSAIFGGLSSTQSSKSMEALARGISEVLLCTQAGLSVAIPGLVIIYLAHSGTQHCLCVLRSPDAHQV
jgi:biopolymer transport protein ExbB